MEHAGPILTADESLERLIEGNKRFVEGRPTGLGNYRYGVSDLTAGQQPFATILGCSDSRVPPELIFDVGLGELFVIRVAGNFMSPEVAGSFQYAGAHLHTPLFVIMGHTGCGAINAALDSIENDTQHRSRIQILVDTIIPAIGDLDPGLSKAERLAQAVENNVRWTVREILDSPEGRTRVEEGVYRVVAAIYDIETGHVKFLS